jgi:tRNA threonylcarbamoyladenosine biosynthesis protein TsaE
MDEQLIIAASLAETRALAGGLAGPLHTHLVAQGAEVNVLVGLDGELGAGKTAFVQGFVAALDPDVEHDVTSPTFAIVQVYETDPPVTHMDLYRLGALEDLEAIGYRDLYFAPGVTLVEWISRVPEAIPVEWIEIRLAVRMSDVREIRVRAHGARLAEIVEKLVA